jgi:mono/diheme cytochrome c family protein
VRSKGESFMKKRVLLWFFNLLLIGLFTGCGGGSSSNDIPDSTSGHPATSVNRGIAVDPYIVGAIFEEISADGTRILQNSTVSDSNGRFVFTNPVQDGSTIRIKISSRGMHGNAPFTGILKRKVYAGDAQEAVVSPLTTLLANGMSENEVIALLANAGLGNLEPEDLTRDPMQGLAGATGNINNDQLRGLQANMAVNALLQSIDNFDYAGEELDQVNFADFVQLSQQTLSPENFSHSGANLHFNEFANAVIDAQRTVVSQIRQELAAGSTRISTEHFGQLRSAAVEQMTAHFDSGTPVVDPPTAPGTTPAAFAAADFFADNCAFCHSLGTGSGFMDLAGDGAKLASKFANGANHNGNSLSLDESLAMADFLNANAAAEPPPAPMTGPELYASECQGCHGSLATSNISNRSFGGVADAIAANIGGMGALILTDDQLSLIADSLPTITPPTAPLADRSGIEIYDH